MRIPKLIAYLAVGLLLPLWLYNFTNEGLTKQELKDELKRLQNAKKQEQDSILVSSHLQTEQSLQELIQLSSANATTLQGILAMYPSSFNDGVKVFSLPNDVNQRNLDTSTSYFANINSEAILIKKPIHLLGQMDALRTEYFVFGTIEYTDKYGKLKDTTFNCSIQLKPN